MNDVEKTNIERKNSGKRMRRRRRMMSIYAVIVIFLVLSAGIVMCFTFLFNADEIIVSGESLTYTSQNIVEASGIKAGDNLLRLKRKVAEKNILEELRYVETATVERDFPSTIRINVTRCIPAYNVRYDTGVLLVSRKGKILENGTTYRDVENLPVIYGFEPEVMELGMQLSSKNSRKFEAFNQIISRFDRDNNEQIATIDLTNEYDIVVTYRNDLVFKMGNWNDVDYKLDLAQSVMNDESIIGKSGTLVMVGSNQCSFRNNYSERKETASTPAQESQTVQDGNNA
ncbi:MAG: FtsQ-type POTRA domain-containing protein [Ruminococcus sp.]|nr:FtsQ-type POTRA domain-containing protein [Ruminococcus sp.]MDE6784465.1 FtsQ-type POTRA domain-containing protein [Ruminococcus sp.]